MEQKNISRRSFLKGAAGLAGAAAMTAVVPAMAEQAVYTPGTYTATAVGYNDAPVTVTMTFSETAITDVVIDASSQTPALGGVAAESLKDQIMNGQTALVDGMTGATMTSNAVKKAAAQCIAEAKGVDVATVLAAGADTAETETKTADWLGEEPVVESIAKTMDTDLLIVGAGNGGLAAAVEAADEGMNFILAEKHSTICDTRNWFGAVNSKQAAAKGVVLNKMKVLNELSRYASGKADMRVQKVWVDESGATADKVDEIMAAYGMVCDFEADTGVPSDENDAYAYRPAIQHYYVAGADCPDEYKKMKRNQIFLDYIQKKGYDVTCNLDLVKLVKDGDRVTGAIFQDTETKEYVQINAAKGVLLTTGGYAANPEMLEALSPTTAAITSLSYYWPLNTGVGLKAAVWAGAARDPEEAPMIFDRGLVKPGEDAGYTTDEFGNKCFRGVGKQWNCTTQPFLKVNRRGERVINESTPYNDNIFTAYSQPGRVLCQIFDANFPEDVTRFHTLGCSAQTRQQLPRFWGTDGTDGDIQAKVDGGYIMKADTLDELADKLGFVGEDKETFLATVAHYNDLVAAGEDTDFGKEAYRLSSISKAPFYGSWFGASLLTTGDGMRINNKMQVLSTEYKPIPGLYAAGDCSGSFFSDNYPELFPGVAVGRTLTFAMKAVRQINGTDK